MEEEQMSYNQFLEEIRVAVQEILGSGYEIKIQQIRKNNGVLLDGLIIGKERNSVAPTIYLNSYYMDYSQGKSMDKILEDIMFMYKENSDVNLGEMRKLLDFNNLKDKVAFKLIQKEKNKELLKEVPYFEFLDLAVVFYIILDENQGGKMTALIHNSHMEEWGITGEELDHLAKKNTPVLLPPEIRTMEEVIRDIFTKQFSEFSDDPFEDLFGTDQNNPSIYVLSNKKQINGAGCILYEGYVKQFAEEQKADIIILPSSVHETLLIPDGGNLKYEELKEMVCQINQSEVPEEDVLSNNIYRYERKMEHIIIVKEG
jgi:hypothetical protein